MSDWRKLLKGNIFRNLIILYFVNIVLVQFSSGLFIIIIYITFFIQSASTGIASRYRFNQIEKDFMDGLEK